MLDAINCDVCRRQIVEAASHYGINVHFPEGNDQICERHQEEIAEAISRYLPALILPARPDLALAA